MCREFRRALWAKDTDLGVSSVCIGDSEVHLDQ